MSQSPTKNSTQRRDYFQHLLNDSRDKRGLRQRKNEILKHSGVKHLYKYCNLETAEKIIEKGLLLQPPDNYNDPFDCLSGVSVWSASTRFIPDATHIRQAVSKINSDIPTRFRIENYSLGLDMRASYYFETTCFSENYDNHLMWSHYGENHKGFCLEFEIAPFLDDVHPCYYANQMPNQLDWRTGNLALATIKGSAWSYEREWRIVRETSRPLMRILGAFTHQIYNSIHTNPAFSPTDFAEWNQISHDLHEKIGREYHRERSLDIRPSRIYLGLNIDDQYSNENKAHSCENIRRISKLNNIPVSRMFAKGDSFEFFTKEVIDRPGWAQPNG